MKKYKTSERLNQLMELRQLKQIDILNIAQPFCKKYDVKLGKSDISQYVSGKVEPGQDKLYILATALNVNVAWLMGFEVPMNDDASAQGVTKNYNILSDVPKPSEVDPDLFVLHMYKQLDPEDKAEIRGEMKQMLKADKYSNNRHSYDEIIPVRMAAKGHGTREVAYTREQHERALAALQELDDDE